MAAVAGRFAFGGCQGKVPIGMNFLAVQVSRWLTPHLLRFLSRRPYRLLYCILAEEIGLVGLAIVFWGDDKLRPAQRWGIEGFFAVGFLFFAGWAFWYFCRVRLNTWQAYWEEVLERYG